MEETIWTVEPADINFIEGEMILRDQTGTAIAILLKTGNVLTTGGMTELIARDLFNDVSLRQNF